MQQSELVKFVAALLLLCTTPALAASGHRGAVRFNELPVPGATAIATQGDKKFVAITDPQGIYLFPDLPDGTWIVRVEMLGFQPIKREVAIGQGKSEIVWDLTMLPLSEMKTESIPAALSGAPEFQRADLITASEPSDTPANLAAGATPAPQGQTGTASPFANLSPEQLSERAADGFLINGSVNNGAASPFAQLAAFGNNRRGFKSLYYGNVGLVLDNSALDARPFSLTGQNTPKPDYNRSQLSINFGGPLNIPHLINKGPSFFVGYQRIRNRNAIVQTSRMPTLEERNGDLSGARSPLGQAIQIVDPRTGLPFADNEIPPERISQQARSLLSLFPLPNTAGTGRYNYQVPIVADTHQDAVQGWLRRWQPMGQISGTFNYQSIRTDNPNVFAFLDTGRASSLGIGASFFRSFNQFFSMELRYQFDRSKRRTTPYFANHINVSGDIGISGNNQEPGNWGPPNLSFSNYERLSDAENSYDREQTNFVAGSVRINRGQHYVTMGLDYRRQQINLFSQQNSRGTYTFTGAASGYDFADFLLGIPDTSSIAFGNADKYLRAASYAVYINDDWRISAGFSLNAGVRWEYEAPVTELYGRLVNLDITRDFTKAAAVLAADPTGLLTGRKYPDSLVNPDKRGIQPRVGFAWRPAAASSLVIRGGYGIYRDNSVYRSIANQMAQQSPFSKSMNVGNGPDTPLTLANGFSSAPRDIPNTFAIDPDFRVAIAQNWQLSIQRDFPFSLQMVATYLGAKGSHLTQRSLPNTYPAGSANACTTCPSGFVYETSNGSSIRHAGHIQLRRRLQRGFSAGITYSFSKSIDDAALSDAGQGGQGGSLIAQNWLNLKAERALSSFDQRHLLNVQAQYTTGSGGFHSVLLGGWKGALLKEWTVTGQMSIGSGLPLTPIYSVAVYGTGITGSIRPSRTAASISDAPAGLFLNPAAYVPPPAGEWGNAGRNSITGPDRFSLDMSLTRSFRIRDRYNIDFRLDSSNILNHVTFPGWNAVIDSSQFGLPVQSNPMRKVQANIRVSF
jgi:hypothetical protein